MLDLKELVEMYVIEASDPRYLRQHTSAEIRKAFFKAIKPLEKKEERQRLEKLAKQLTFRKAEATLESATLEYWDSDVVDELQEVLNIRFPKKRKEIDEIMYIALIASNVTDPCGYPPVNYENAYKRVYRALKKLPWRVKRRRR